MLSESYFSFAPFTTFATNAFNIRDNYCRLQKNVVTLQCHSDKRLKSQAKVGGHYTSASPSLLNRFKSVPYGPPPTPPRGRD